MAVCDRHEARWETVSEPSGISWAELVARETSDGASSVPAQPIPSANLPLSTSAAPGSATQNQQESQDYFASQSDAFFDSKALDALMACPPPPPAASGEASRKRNVPEEAESDDMVVDSAEPSTPGYKRVQTTPRAVESHGRDSVETLPDEASSHSSASLGAAAEPPASMPFFQSARGRPIVVREENLARARETIARFDQLNNEEEVRSPVTPRAFGAASSIRQASTFSSASTVQMEDDHDDLNESPMVGSTGVPYFPRVGLTPNASRGGSSGLVSPSPMRRPAFSPRGRGGVRPFRPPSRITPSGNN